MPAPIGGGNGMDAIGNLLAGAGAGGAGAPPVAASGAPGSGGQPMDPAAAQADAMQAQLMQGMQQIRAFGDQAKQLMTTYPQLADSVQQILEICKQMVVQIASPVPMQTGSSMQVPGNGGGA